MMEFITKFFGYYPDEWGGIEVYRDGLGGGAYSDWRHFAWIALTVALAVVIYKACKRHPAGGRRAALVMAIIMFSIRFINQLIRAIIGAEYPVLRAFPFHMCTVLTFLLPLVVVFNWKKLRTAVFVLSMMGGIVTVLVGSYFDNKFLTFGACEGMWAHMALLYIPLMYMAAGDWELRLREIWQPVAGVLALALWATFANEVLFRGWNTNYMYLKRNILPGNFGGDWFLVLFAGIFAIMLLAIFLIPHFYRKRRLQGTGVSAQGR